MDETRHMLGQMMKSLGVPLVVALMVPLALLAALGFYLLALVEGFWQLCRSVPAWVIGLRYRHPRSKPHFADAHVISQRRDRSI